MERIELSNGYWTEEEGLAEKAEFKGTVPLPVGKVGSQCPKCNGTNLVGILMSENANEEDPNIACNDCHYVWD